MAVRSSENSASQSTGSTTTKPFVGSGVTSMPAAFDSNEDLRKTVSEPRKVSSAKGRTK
ncbi:hypothetical protein D3C83_307390 [compost metagenome]